MSLDTFRSFVYGREQKDDDNNDNNSIPTSKRSLDENESIREGGEEELFFDIDLPPSLLRDSTRCRWCGFYADERVTCRGLMSFRLTLLNDDPYYKKLLFCSRECQKSTIEILNVRREVKERDYVALQIIADRTVLFAPSYHALKHFPFGGTVESREEFLRPVRSAAADSKLLNANDLQMIALEETAYQDYCRVLISGFNAMRLEEEEEKSDIDDDGGDCDKKERKKIKK